MVGGHAKTLMFVQLNPDVNSYSETLSTLKFAERVSGVELGAARSNKEGRDVRELVEQVLFVILAFAHFVFRFIFCSFIVITIMFARFNSELLRGLNIFSRSYWIFN